jgi:hypothetical protein
MDVLLKSLTQHSGELLLFLIAATVVLMVWTLRLGLQATRTQARWKDLLVGTRGDSIETMLYEHLRDRLRLEAQIEALEARVFELETKVSTSKRHLGLVRYDAFDDVGGSQSFALALYDDEGSGAVVTSVVGRSDCRVFCKPLLNGGSERTLSQEEQRAIREARSEGPKTIVSH